LPKFPFDPGLASSTGLKLVTCFGWDMASSALVTCFGGLAARSFGSSISVHGMLLEHYLCYLAECYDRSWPFSDGTLLDHQV